MEITENIIVTLHGYYEYHSHLANDLTIEMDIPAEGCKLALEYLFSDSSFRAFIKENIGRIKEQLSTTKQPLQEVALLIGFNEDEGWATLYLYTAKGAYVDIKYTPRLSYADFYNSVETVQKGLLLKEYLFKTAKDSEKKENRVLLSCLVGGFGLWALCIYTINLLKENSERIIYYVLCGSIIFLFIHVILKMYVRQFISANPNRSVSKMFNLEDL